MLKKYTTLIIAVTLILGVCGDSYGQKNKIEKANKEFDKFSYIDAREIYLKVVEDGYESAQVFQKLGDTYYFNGEYKDAASWYRKSIDKFPLKTEPLYYYRAAQSFKSLGNVEESNELMLMFQTLGGSGLVAKEYDVSDETDYLASTAFGNKKYIFEKVSINSDGSDFGPSFYLKQLVFAKAAEGTTGDKVHEWNQQPFLDLFAADMDENGVLSNVNPLPGDINTKFHESSTSFSQDGGTVYFTRNNFTDGKKGRDKDKTIRLKLYKATRSGDSFWTNIVELPFNSNDYSVAHPTLSKDEKRLYFASDMPGTIGMSDIWYVEILPDGMYGDPVNLGPTINTEARETFPYISNANNMYFSSDGRSGLGGLDVFATALDEKGEPGPIVNMGEPVNSGLDDFGFILNEETKIGYLSSNRSGNKGSVSDDIYRIKEECAISITGIVTNRDTGAVIPNATVNLLDSDNNIIDTVTSGVDGAYAFNETAACSSTYLVRGKSESCDYHEELVETPSATRGIEVPLALKCDPCPANDLGCRLALNPIYFDFDRYNIRPDAELELAKILVAMREYPQLIIHIESHTDSRGVDSYNEALSEKRAQSTLGWLVEKGIAKSRLSAKGYGEYQLQNQCSNGVKCTEEEHQLNRRSMFIIQN